MRCEENYLEHCLDTIDAMLTQVDLFSRMPSRWEAPSERTCFYERHKKALHQLMDYWTAYCEESGPSVEWLKRAADQIIGCRTWMSLADSGMCTLMRNKGDTSAKAEGPFEHMREGLEEARRIIHENMPG